MPGRIDRRWWAGAAIVAVIGIALRLWHIATTPLWLDEAYSAYAAAHDFAFLWQVVPRYETHPPFYYTLLRLWTLAFGDSLIALRAPGLLAGLATPPMLAACAWSAGGLIGASHAVRVRATFCAFALACLSIPLVEMSREVRPYPLMILTYGAATLAVLALARRTARGGSVRGRAYAVYLAALAVMLWLHNLGVLFALALVLALGTALIGRRIARADWVWVVIGHGGVGLLWLPALAILHDQAPTWIGSTWLRFSWASVPEKLAILYAVPGIQAVSAILLGALALSALASAGERRRLLAILLALAGLPVLLSLAISVTVSPVFLTRTLTPVASPALLLLSFGAVLFADWRRWLGLGGALMLAANMLAVDLQARAGGPAQNWYGAVAWLRLRFQPGDVIVAYPNEGALPMAYALRDEGLAWPITPIPTPVPSFDQAGGRYPTGSRGVVSLPRARLHTIARSPTLRRVPTIWLLRLGASTYDPGDVLLDELHGDRYIIRHFTDGPIDVIGLRRRALADQRNTKK